MNAFILIGAGLALEITGADVTPMVLFKIGVLMVTCSVLDRCFFSRRTK